MCHALCRAAKQAAEARRAARRPLWQPEYLERFPRRGSTLDQHVQVSELPPGELELVELYLAWRVPQHVAAALRRVWQSHPNALRVKELFETLETYALIERQLSILCARCAKQGRQSEALQHVFDLACGHGLLGVLLACRFPALRVVCVDLERCSRLSVAHLCGVCFSVFRVSVTFQRDAACVAFQRASACVTQTVVSVCYTVAACATVCVCARVRGFNV